MGIVMRMVGGTDLDVGGDTEGRFIHDHPDHSLSDTVRESSSLSSPQAEPLHTGATQVGGDLYDRRCDSGRTEYVAETGGWSVKLPRFRGVFASLHGYAVVVISSLAASYAIGER